MSFHLKKTELLSAGLQRIAREQIDKAIGELTDDGLDQHERIHQFRKRCKKLRGLIRLVRPAFEKTYKQENEWYRDRSRELSRVRDAEAMIEAIEALQDGTEDPSDEERQLLNRSAEVLREHKQSIAAEWVDLDDRLSGLVSEAREARERVSNWKLKPDSVDAIRKGIKKTYRRGYNALADAVDDPSTDKLHGLRKRTKYHWYHLLLLRDAFEPVLEARAVQCKLLSDYLGDEHDLAVLTRFILDDPDRFGDAASLERLMQIIQRRRQQLQADGLQLARKLYAESPSNFVKRVVKYWTIWRDE